jgi:hypothetical protein
MNFERSRGREAALRWGNPRDPAIAADLRRSPHPVRALGWRWAYFRPSCSLRVVLCQFPIVISVRAKGQSPGGQVGAVASRRVQKYAKCCELLPSTRAVGEASVYHVKSLFVRHQIKKRLERNVRFLAVLVQEWLVLGSTGLDDWKHVAGIHRCVV